MCVGDEVFTLYCHHHHAILGCGQVGTVELEHASAVCLSTGVDAQLL